MMTILVVLLDGGRIEQETIEDRVAREPNHIVRLVVKAQPNNALSEVVHDHLKETCRYHHDHLKETCRGRYRIKSMRHP